MEGWTWARPHPPGLGGKESPGAPPNPRAAPSCPPSPARPRPEEPPAACKAADPSSPHPPRPHPHPLPPPASRGPVTCSSKRLTTAWTHSTGLCAAMSSPRPGGGGWPGGPASGTRRRAGGADVKAAASRAAEECGQLAFPRGWGRGPARPAGRGTGEGGVGEEAGGGGGEGNPGRGGRLWVALPTSAVSPQPSQSETPP